MDMRLITNALADALDNLPHGSECAELVYKALCEMERSPEYAPIQAQIRQQTQSTAAACWTNGHTQQGRNTETKTLRDEIAITAMQGLIAASGNKGCVEYKEEIVAESAYAMADAMLAERAK